MVHYIRCYWWSVSEGLTCNLLGTGLFQSLPYRWFRTVSLCRFTTLVIVQPASLGWSVAVMASIRCSSPTLPRWRNTSVGLTRLWYHSSGTTCWEALNCPSLLVSNSVRCKHNAHRKTNHVISVIILVLILGFLQGSYVEWEAVMSADFYFHLITCTGNWI